MVIVSEKKRESKQKCKARTEQHFTKIHSSLTSRNSSVTNSAAVLNRQDAAAWARQSPQFRMFAPVADSDPPYMSNAVVRSISSSPERASAFPARNLGYDGELRADIMI